ncbi:hypothetical protein LPJ66_005958 [Kickxella alabastrina]|uniref:Uncharacterized protein n=1 Tax=Kickxella alabastrina TaxID=61397 RepID=A0ACC1IH36_9FUNG|nr:hypothetical protein LPJ66_005958 [Kickxella alabastrina]
MSQAVRFGSAFVARSAGASMAKTSASKTLKFQPRHVMAVFGRRSVAGNKQSIWAAGSLTRGFHSSPQRLNEAAAPTEAMVAVASSDTPAVATTVTATASAEPADTVSTMLQASIDPSIGTESMMQIGDLAKHGLDTYFPTRLMEYTLEFAHVATGLPWWATIAVVVVGIRAAAFPLAAWSQRHMAGVNRVKPEFTLLMDKQRAAAASGDIMSSARLSQEMSSFYKKRGVSPFKAMWGNLVTVPFMMGMFFGLKDMALLSSVTHMNTGGLWWFTDLTLPDPTYILPALSCIGMMGVMELQSKMNSPTEQSRNMKYGMRAAGVLMAYLTSGMPADVFVFWITNNILSYLQVSVLHSKKFREKIGIVDIEKVRYAREPESMMSKLDLSAITGKAKSKKFVVKRK